MLPQTQTTLNPRSLHRRWIIQHDTPFLLRYEDCPACAVGLAATSEDARRICGAHNATVHRLSTICAPAEMGPMEFLPCPFCGNSTKEIFHGEDRYSHVICRACGTCGPSMHTPEVERVTEAAILAWNKRVPDLRDVIRKAEGVPSVEQEGNEVR